MNPIGSLYLRATSLARAHIPSMRPTSREAILKQEFLHEWLERRQIDQTQMLPKMLEQTAAHVPFYKEYFSANREADPTRLSDWPVLTRELLLNNFDDLKSNVDGRYRTWTHASGGSTGKPVIVVHDEYFSAKASALRQLCADVFFKGPHYNKLILWGMSKEVEQKNKADKPKLGDRIRMLMGLKTTHINTFDFTKEKFEQCVNILREQKPEFIFGYAGSVYELAKYLEEQAIRPSSKVKMVGTTAQTLHPFMRECIERVFDCRVCDHYGSREVGPLAWQNEGGLMCFPSFFSKIEVVDADGNAAPEGEEGRILVTTLHNHTMPLIRYDIGDRGIAGPDIEYCGYPCATLSQISGRSSEEFTTVHGSRVCGPFFINLFYYRPWLDQFYIVQRDYDHIEIMYVPKVKNQTIPESDLEEINGRIKDVMTEACRIQWSPVDEIPTTKAGKRLYIRSEVPPLQVAV